MRTLKRGLLVAFMVALPSLASAQGTQIALGGLAIDGSQPVEVTADKLEVDQESGTAVFSGGVVIEQGSLRLSAGEVDVTYGTEDSGDGAGIQLMVATGGVTLANGPDAASAEEATYDLRAGTLKMSGGVVLKQGQTTISGDRFQVNITTGAGRMDGNVRTVFRAQGN